MRSPEQAFGLAPARPETLMQRAVERIIHSDVVGACYTELRNNYGSSIKNWLPRLGQNDYDWLKLNQISILIRSRLKV